jgi:hypothetical protein
MKLEQVERIIVRRYVSELFSRYDIKNYYVNSISSEEPVLFCERSVIKFSKLHLFFIKSYKTKVVVSPFNF